MKILLDNGHGIDTPGKRSPDLEADFYLLRRTLPPAVLVENFFMDSRRDCAFLLSPEGQQAIVNTHIAGISAYLVGASY